MIQALRGLQALRDLLEQTAQCQDRQVQLVQRVILDQLVLQAQRVLLVIQALLDQQVQREQPVPQDLLVLLVRQAQVQLHCQTS